MGCEAHVMNGYLKNREVAEKWGISVRRINALCLEGRLEGNFKFGNTWAATDELASQMMKSGKYVRMKSVKEDSKWV